MDRYDHFKRNLTEGVTEIIKKHGWTSEFINEQNLLQLKIAGSIKNAAMNSYEVAMSLILLRYKFCDGYLVSKFETWAGRANNDINLNIIRGIKVFAYYGYHFAKPEDNKRRLPKSILLITCPADIEELFRKHNHVSQMYGADRLFIAIN